MIPLPKLPRPNSAGYYYINEAEVQDIQREAMRAGLEAAAKCCDQTDMHAKPKLGVDCADTIRALRIEGETP